MKGHVFMERELSVTKAREQFAELVDQVQYKGDSVIINRSGKPVAVLVSVDIYEQWRQERRDFFSHIRQMQSSAGLEPDEADRLANEAVAEIRNRAQSSS